MLHTKVITTIGFLLCLTQQAMATDFASYRAVYELQPIRIDQGLKVTPIDGELAYEVNGSECAGWTVTSDLLNRSAEAELGMRVSEIKSQSFETNDGLLMTVSQQETVNSHLVDNQEIKIHKDAPDATASGTVAGSKSLNFTIASGSIFPTQHQKKLLEAAMKGETRDVSNVYDGSDGSKQFRIVSFIGKKHPAAEQSRPELAPLSKLASWSLQLGYYPIDDSQTETPEFQATFNLFENGISTEMLFDYGSYAMRAKLSKLEILAAPKCDPAQIKLK